MGWRSLPPAPLPGGLVRVLGPITCRGLQAQDRVLAHMLHVVHSALDSAGCIREKRLTVDHNTHNTIGSSEVAVEVEVNGWLGSAAPYNRREAKSRAECPVVPPPDVCRSENVINCQCQWEANPVMMHNYKRTSICRLAHFHSRRSALHILHYRVYSFVLCALGLCRPCVQAVRASHS
jgi:hypothetical protein